jgi:hypothetical protein
VTPVDTRQTCAACGHVGYDVSTRIVAREPTEDDPTEYRAEPRCINRVACDERQEADS